MNWTFLHYQSQAIFSLFHFLFDASWYKIEFQQWLATYHTVAMQHCCALHLQRILETFQFTRADFFSIFFLLFSILFWFRHRVATAVYQVTRPGHEHCDATEGILLDITPLVVDGKKLVTLYDKDLTEGVNLLIGT